ncbi:flp pilus-assembly TadE/G-like family protein [Calidifontibacter sp. DB0510]|uniref:Flp pilus-assembly TadE/G-like family protein n=2 Tax=Metallococcus carri TaxID=1656884 RepID=A0A967E8M8_9MICO|nr:flp pilus-assembly TadE/G-like family protein [Metallococcus carri]NOP36474.1 flp pilus-assembly TadE/G-like family protein [Calidifontibacter sp. DB2511S]
MLVTLLLTVLALLAAVRASTTARTAADLGALAGAGRLVAGENACAAAESIIRANGAAMTGCRVAGSEVTVTTAVSSRMPGWPDAIAIARAGPPIQPTGPPTRRQPGKLPVRRPAMTSRRGPPPPRIGAIS